MFQVPPPRPPPSTDSQCCYVSPSPAIAVKRWDGAGYPDGLRGEAVPLGARILAVVDAYGAMTETRPYRAARPHAEAVEELRRCSGTQFDPRVVEVFSTIIERRKDGTREGAPGA